MSQSAFDFSASAYRLTEAGLHWPCGLSHPLATSFFQKLFICLSVKALYVTACYINYDLRVAGGFCVCSFSGLSIG